MVDRSYILLVRACVFLFLFACIGSALGMDRRTALTIVCSPLLLFIFAPAWAIAAGFMDGFRDGMRERRRK